MYSISRRGPDTAPVCYPFSSEISTTTTTAASDAVTILKDTTTDSTTVTPSPTTVSHSPVMRGVNVAVAVGT